MNRLNLVEQAEGKKTLADQSAQAFPDNLKNAMLLADMFADIRADEYVVPGTLQQQPELQTAKIYADAEIGFTRL